MRTVITSARLLTPETTIQRPVVIIEDEVIAAIGSEETTGIPSAARHLDFPEATLVPTFFDIHMHGGGGHDVMEATPSALDAIGLFLASRGVGSYLATTVTAQVDEILRSLEGLAQQMERTDHPGATPRGIHLEGPFLSCEKRGVHPPRYLQQPSIELFDRFYQAARGHIALITIAPELPNALDLIVHAARLGVRVSLGHSNATTEPALAGIAAGARSATHTFNAMRSLDHRDPGLLGVVLDQADLYAEIICDGIHVHPMIARIFWKAKGPDRTILVTDAISATGMPDGTYKLGSFDVTVENGTCLYEGKLAGSVLTLDSAIKNFMAFTDCGLQAALRCATLNPAKMMGFENHLATLEPGRVADITVLSPTGSVQAVLLRGSLIAEGHSTAVA